MVHYRQASSLRHILRNGPRMELTYVHWSRIGVAVEQYLPRVCLTGPIAAYRRPAGGLLLAYDRPSIGLALANTVLAHQRLRDERTITRLVGGRRAREGGAVSILRRAAVSVLFWWCGEAISG